MTLGLARSLLKRWIFGFKPHAQYGSNARRLLSRFAAVFAGVTVFACVSGIRGRPIAFDHMLSIVAVVWSPVYFVITVLAVPFLTSHSFKVDVGRLFIDTLISIGLAISAFAFYYQVNGLVQPTGEPEPGLKDFYYFSAVTFSTVGFGDFRPAETSRIAAAAQAILGNLHLGLIAGSAFFAATANSSELSLKE